MDELIDALHEEEVSAEELHVLQQRFTDAIKSLPGYRDMEIIDQTLSTHGSDDSPLLLCRQNGKLYLRKKEKERRNISGTFRIIVSLLIIMLGFAMIVLPTPPSFEMYTLFLFNDHDGFTLMDLISLMIVFAGIYALITSVYKQRERSY
jgi:hypothetical protein